MHAEEGCKGGAWMKRCELEGLWEQRRSSEGHKPAQDGEESDAEGNLGQARSAFTTWPWTSVSR